MYQVCIGVSVCMCMGVSGVCVPAITAGRACRAASLDAQQFVPVSSVCQQCVAELEPTKYNELVVSRPRQIINLPV